MAVLFATCIVLLSLTNGITNAGKAPKAPSNLRITESTLTSMTIAWDKPSDEGDGPLLSYEVFYEYYCGSLFYCVAPITPIPSPDTTTHTLTNLRPNVKHYVFVLAVNKYGRSRLGRIKGKSVVKTAAPTEAPPPTTSAQTTMKETTVEPTEVQTTMAASTGETTKAEITTSTLGSEAVTTISTEVQETTLAATTGETTEAKSTEKSEDKTTDKPETVTTEKLETTSRGFADVPLGTEPTTLPPKESCEMALGIESEWLDDTQFVSSSYDMPTDSYYYYGRLNLPDRAWVAGSADTAPWWQVGLYKQSVVTGIAIQGHPTLDYWVTKLRLEYAIDAVSWYEIGTYNGSTDRNTVVRIDFEPIKLTNLIINVLDVNNRAAIRAEIYGCDHKMPTCGIRPSETMRRYRRIVGGVESTESSWPWVGAMEFEGETFCTATLIDEQWAVTAAHCFNEENDRAEKEGWKVIFGKHSLSKNTDHQQTRLISEVYNHPDHDAFYYRPERELRYDLALFRLDRSIQFEEKIKPVCELNPVVEFGAGDSCFSVGWGKTSSDGSRSDVLRQVNYNIVNGTKCNGDLDVELSEDFICAGSDEGGKGSCEFDGGNGVYCQKDGYFYLAGLVSEVGDCTSNHQYEKLTNMKVMREFLKKTKKDHTK